MEPKELFPIRIVQLYMEPQKCQECPWEGIIIISRTWTLSSRVISGLAVGHEIWFGWLERTLSSFCKTLKGVNGTKVIVQVYLIQLHLINVASQLCKAVF